MSAWEMHSAERPDMKFKWWDVVTTPLVLVVFAIPLTFCWTMEGVRRIRKQPVS